MKKMLFVIVALVGLTATSCSTEKKINKRLEGDWNVVSYDGVATAAGESEVYSFVKTEKTSGTGVYTATGSGLSFTLPFTYSIEENKMTVTTTFLGTSETEVLTVTKYEKDAMEFTESDGTITVLEPK